MDLDCIEYCSNDDYIDDSGCDSYVNEFTNEFYDSCQTSNGFMCFYDFKELYLSSFDTSLHDCYKIREDYFQCDLVRCKNWEEAKSYLLKNRNIREK
jgi:hypothetical protein